MVAMVELNLMKGDGEMVLVIEMEEEGGNER